MRLFYFLLMLLTPTLCFGQACTEASFFPVPTSPFPPAGYNTYNCATLTISSAGLNRVADATDEPFIIVVTGNVVINGDIKVDGGAGFNLPADPTLGPAGGAGASRGGGVSGSEGEPGGPFTFFAPEGGAPFRNVGCNHGGGGAGGFLLTGANGGNCGDPSIPGAGGAAWGAFPGPLRGGFGGGAGGAADVLGVYNLGSGGGGGGALEIRSTGGTITIASGVTISSRGGKGGNATGPGGAGGGGSGGVIVIDGALGVTNLGTIDVRGGAAGTNPDAGADGGVGRSGVFRVVNAGITTDGTGLSIPASSATAKLNSDITCGTVALKEDDRRLLFQMISGFLIALMMGLLIKTLSRIPKKLL